MKRELEGKPDPDQKAVDSTSLTALRGAEQMRAVTARASDSDGDGFWNDGSYGRGRTGR